MSTITASVSRDGVFMKWLQDNPSAVVKVLGEGNEAYAQITLGSSNDQEEEKERSGAANKAASASTEASTYFTPELLLAMRERSSRLRPLDRWNPRTEKVGLSNVAFSASHVRLRELRAMVCHMEDSTQLNHTERFKRYCEEGYVLVKDVFGSRDGQAILARLREALCSSTKQELDVILNPETMEVHSEVETTVKSDKKRKMVAEVDKTIQVFPGPENQDEWSSSVVSAAHVLDSPQMLDLVEGFRKGAVAIHETELSLTRKFGWARLRGRLPTRKEWTEYYFLKSWERDEKEMLKFDGRYARELTKRKENPKPRYAFSVWIAVGPNPIDGGGMALLPGSQFLTGFLRPRPNEEVPSDFRKQVQTMPWVMDDLNPGDVLIVDMQTTRAFALNRRVPGFVGAFADSMYTLT